MNKHTVLVVDDEVINRKILSKLLEKDYSVLEAENGKAALEILKENGTAISVILLDIIMPVMDGYSLLKILQDDPQLSKIPVIVSSQKDGDEAELRALSLGANDFVSKPYKSDIILHRIKNTISLYESAALANRAEKDELTGLMSKQFFVESANEILHQNPDIQYDMYCYDMERFKLVNDTYGEKTGDKLLCYLASIIDSNPEAVCATRFTSDHFYQFRPHSNKDKSLMDKEYREFLDKANEFDIELKININCGIYHIKNIDSGVISMCDRAKLAADINSEHAEDYYTFYDDSIRKQLINEQFIIGAMREGIEEHQFKVYYQPKYDLHTEMIAGAEALVRWIHPERGFMSPGDFIPIFEKNGFISQLDRYVWEETCKNIRSWMDRGLPPVPVSVNVSRADIYNPHLADVLLGLIEKYNIPIPYLHLEITESAYTDNPKQIISSVEQLHNLGFVIEMDDFGSGYSSLNMLAELPVDILKLDMGFVQSEVTHSSGRGIISFVISLAKWMKLSVIAEGVETADQIEALRSMDCNFVQGYYFAKPMPVDAFEDTLKTVAVTAVRDAEQIPKKAPEEKAETEEPTEKRVMLIVDDIEVNRAVLNSAFCDEFNVVEMENGKQALDYLSTNSEDVAVILLDLLMPVMDGFQFITKLKENEALSSLPVIVTSQGDVTAEERALDLGADDFISKPYSPQIVGHRVHNVIQVHNAQSARLIELNETKKREQTLMNSIPGGVAIYHLKKSGKVATEFVSDGLAKLCGYTSEEFLDYIRDDARINVVPEDIPVLASATKRSLVDNGLIHEIQHIYTKDKKVLTVRLDASISVEAQLEEDDIAILYAVHTKVSDEALVLMREQNRFRYILDNLDVAYFEIDADGSFYASDKYSLYSLSDAKQQDIQKNSGNFEGVHPEDLPKLFEFYRMKEQNLPKISTTLRLRMRDGSYRWTETMGFYDYDSEGNRIRSFGVFRDVDSEWQNRNRELQEALTAAEKANRTKSDFLARVSHEMRTPLNGILGLAELMSGKTSGDSISEDIEELKQSGHYLLDIINDTLDVSVIEDGKMQLHPTVCDGKAAFNNVISMVKPSMDEKHINFIMKAENLPFTMLYIDVGRVEQAVMNILSNAVKFTPEGGTISFTMENVSKNDKIITDRIVIKDTGIGIAKDFLEHIYEPFAQEHSDSKSLYSGTGLGMTIAKQCLDLMGGTITVSSEPGKGTEVSIILPMPIANGEQLDTWHSEQEKEDLIALQGKRILICEDHPLNAQISVRLLKKKGIYADVAENGKIGLDTFAASPDGYYSAVLMDIRMPVMDGLEATRAIRKLKRKDASLVPIIAMTANAMREDVKNALNAGVTEHLGKPVEPAKLYRTLSKLISQQNSHAGKKILIVDDIEMNRAMVRKAIESMYTVLEASCGVEALEVLSRNQDVAAIVTDIQMPRMDGKELISRLRAERKYDNIAILANTIYGDHKQEDELISLGANDFVYKPSSPQVILLRLEHILRNMS